MESLALISFLYIIAITIYQGEKDIKGKQGKKIHSTSAH